MICQTLGKCKLPVAHSKLTSLIKYVMQLRIFHFLHLGAKIFTENVKCYAMQTSKLEKCHRQKQER